MDVNNLENLKRAFKNAKRKNGKLILRCLQPHNSIYGDMIHGMVKSLKCGKLGNPFLKEICNDLECNALVIWRDDNGCYQSSAGSIGEEYLPHFKEAFKGKIYYDSNKYKIDRDTIIKIMLRESLDVQEAFYEWVTDESNDKYNGYHVVMDLSC